MFLISLASQHNQLAAGDQTGLLLQQLIWYLDKAKYVTCSWNDYDTKLTPRLNPF